MAVKKAAATPTKKKTDRTTVEVRMPVRPPKRMRKIAKDVAGLFGYKLTIT